MAKTVSHTVTRPGRKHGQPEVEIPVAEDLASVPGVPQNPVDVASTAGNIRWRHRQ